MFKLTLKSFTRPRKKGERRWIVLSQVIEGRTLNQVLEEIEERFGIKPPSRMCLSNTVYYDGPDGPTIACGFIVTQRMWYGEKMLRCESWVTIHEVIEKPINPKTYVKTKKRTETPA